MPGKKKKKRSIPGGRSYAGALLVEIGGTTDFLRISSAFRRVAWAMLTRAAVQGTALPTALRGWGRGALVYRQDSRTLSAPSMNA